MKVQDAVTYRVFWVWAVFVSEAASVSRGSPPPASPVLDLNSKTSTTKTRFFSMSNFQERTNCFAAQMADQPHCVVEVDTHNQTSGFCFPGIISGLFFWWQTLHKTLSSFALSF